MLVWILLRELHLELAALDVDDIFVRFESSLPVIQDSVRISVLGVQRDDERETSALTSLHIAQ